MGRVVVLDVVGLTPKHLEDLELTPNLNRIAARGHKAKIRPPFPSVTGTVQATLITGKEPREHGIICNGLFNRRRKQVTMWEQTTEPLEGETIWQILKRVEPTCKTGVLFWQYLKYADADIIVTPSPLHGEEGMIEWYFSKPKGWYEEIAARRGDFPLSSFWGPLASFASSKWIAQVALDTIKGLDPNLLLVYLPNLDYNAQRYGPDSQEAKESIREIDQLAGEFAEELQSMGKWEDTSLVILSEYAIHPVSKPVCLNRILREHGWLQVNLIGGREYLDLYHSQAFALVDHQVAHVYVQNGLVEKVQETLESINGVRTVLDDKGKKHWGLDHLNAGELVVVAEKDAWFPYYWWQEEELAPAFARRVDIHQKPGYDPLELFIDPKTRSIPLEPKLIKGSHGTFPDNEEDLVSIISVGPFSQLLEQKAIWEAKDITFFLLSLLGYGS